MKLRFYHLVLLIMIAAGAQPAYSAFWQWSKTAATNATADPTINWAEGMSPSSVNDSARAMMARAAEFRDDTSGFLVATGGPVAYALTTNQGLNAVPNAGQELSFRLPLTNGDAPTLAADGGTVYPIQSSLGVAVASGTLIAFTPYRATFNASSSSWVLQSFFSNPYQIPLGSILWSTAPTAPNSAFVAPSGQCISTTTYAAYWVQQGSPASGGCPGGQFAIIDMRGYVPVALDTLNAAAAGRMTNSGTGCGTAMTSIGAVCANGAQSQNLTLAQLPTGIISATAGAVSVTANTSNKNFPTTAGTFSGTQAAGGAQAANPATTAGGGGDYQTASSMATSGAVTVTSNNTSGTARPNVQPTIGLIPYLRIL